MSKMIPINDCADCPHLSHKGAFGNPANVPLCRKTGLSQEYTKHVNGNRIIASRVIGLPDWCPLPENKEQAD